MGETKQLNIKRQTYYFFDDMIDNIQLSLYPIKYLNELFVPYGSFLETNILLILMLSI